MVKFNRDADKHYILSEECEEDYITEMFEKKPDAAVEYYCGIHDSQNLMDLLTLKQHFSEKGHKTNLEVVEGGDQIYIRIDAKQ